MPNLRTHGSLSILSLVALALTGGGACTANGEIEDFEGPSAPTDAPIIGGSPATAYPEAALVDMYQRASDSFPNSICSGAVIAPRVVLTAGHCVAGIGKWRIKLPYAGNQSVFGSKGATFDWTGSSGQSVDPNQHDVGLVFLDSAVSLPAWPVVANAPVAFGSQVVNIGRIDNGRASNTALFVGPGVTVQDGARIGHRFAYYTNEVIQPGDSGGPDEVPGSSPHKIVAVNSGGGSGRQVLARVDLVYSWIDGQVRANGGWPNASQPIQPPPPPPPPPACASNEREPNDTHTAAGPLSGRTCGALVAGEQDWFTWTSTASSTRWSIAVTADGDAQLQVWRRTSSGYTRLANANATTVSASTTAAGTYVGVVWSPSGRAQNYAVQRTP
jgi:hypothetical protein